MDALVSPLKLPVYRHPHVIETAKVTAFVKDVLRDLPPLPPKTDPGYETARRERIRGIVEQLMPTWQTQLPQIRWMIAVTNALSDS